VVRRWRIRSRRKRLLDAATEGIVSERDSSAGTGQRHTRQPVFEIPGVRGCTCRIDFG